MRSDRPAYRIKVQVEDEWGDLVGRRCMDIKDLKIARTLSSLPDDREIMEEMADKLPFAWMEHEKNVKQEKERKKIIGHVSDLVFREIKHIFESQDKINGYDRND